MREHLVHGSIAAVIAVAVTAGGLAYVPRTVTNVTRSIETSKHAWPDLSDQEKAAITAVAKTLPKGTKFDIVCNDAGCSDLAADIDDAFEDAGIDSVLDRSLGPVGYGIGIQVNEADRPTAEKAVAMLKEASGGRLDPPIVNGSSAPGYVTIIIGKHPR